MGSDSEVKPSDSEYLRPNVIARLVREEFGNWMISENSRGLPDMINRVYPSWSMLKDWQQREVTQLVAEELYGKGYVWSETD